MNSEKAIAALEELDELDRLRRRSSMSAATMSIIPYLMAPRMHYGNGHIKSPHLGNNRGLCRKPKNTDNSPDRAKGMKPFEIEGQTIWAGTLKAAHKKFKLIQHLRRNT